MNKILIEANSISKIFKKGKMNIPVLKNVDFKVHAGETVAIIGSSGAGKSTLLQILGTLDEPTSGKVFFHSDNMKKDLFASSEEDRSIFRNRHMGFVFQFHHLLPEFSALENVIMPGLIAKREEKTLIPIAEKLLAEVGLSNRLGHKPGELSGGECQRVAVARSLFMNPKVIFGDELTGNLDSENSHNLMDFLLQLNKKHGVSLVIVTHDHEVAKRMSRIVEIRDGKLS